MSDLAYVFLEKESDFQKIVDAIKTYFYAQGAACSV
jgi:hypothetical protein